MNKRKIENLQLFLVIILFMIDLLSTTLWGTLPFFAKLLYRSVGFLYFLIATNTFLKTYRDSHNRKHLYFFLFTTIITLSILVSIFSLFI